jgi:hypothetical protein
VRDGKPGVLHLKNIGPNGQAYKKHFLDLNGLGIREMSLDGADLLLLAGPTLNQDGPVSLFRWQSAIATQTESVVAAGTPRLQKLFDVPFGQGDEAGFDHPEGMTILPASENEGRRLIVVYDAASPRRKEGDSSVPRRPVSASLIADQETKTKRTGGRLPAGPRCFRG